MEKTHPACAVGVELRAPSFHAGSACQCGPYRQLRRGQMMNEGCCREGYTKGSLTETTNTCPALRSLGLEM